MARIVHDAPHISECGCKRLGTKKYKDPRNRGKSLVQHKMPPREVNRLSVMWVVSVTSGEPVTAQDNSSVCHFEGSLRAHGHTESTRNTLRPLKMTKRLNLSLVT